MHGATMNYVCNRHIRACFKWLGTAVV